VQALAQSLLKLGGDQKGVGALDVVRTLAGELLARPARLLQRVDLQQRGPLLQGEGGRPCESIQARSW
jgi:hypothetical protein